MIAELKPYDDYRQSVVAWIGKIPSHWNERRGKTLFRKMNRPVQNGDDVVTCFRDGVVTLRKKRRLTGFTNAILEIGYQRIRKGDLVIHAMDAFAGAIGVSDSDGKGTPVYSVCEPKADANSRYFALVTREMARNKWIVALSRGIRERSTDFRFDMFGSQFLPVPPPAEQELIVRFLDWATVRLGKAIAAKRRVIGLLEEQKLAIIHRAVTRGLDDTAPLKPSGLDWLGDVPESFAITKLGRLCKSIRDGTHNPPPAVKGIHRLLSVRNIIRSRFVLRDDDRTMAPHAYSELQRSYTVEPRDIVLALVGGTTGKSAIVEPMENVTVQRSLGILRPKQDLVSSEYLQLVLTSRAIQYQIKEIMNKYAAQPGIYLGDVGRLVFLYPERNLQDAIVRRVMTETVGIDELVRAKLHGINLLQELRTRLTADVVTGKLDVRQFARTLPVDIAEEAAEFASTELSDDEFSDTDDELADELTGEPA